MTEQNHSDPNNGDRFAYMDKKPSKIWKVIKWCFYIIPIFIYLVFGLRLLSTCEGPETSILLTSSQTVQTAGELGKDFKLYTVELHDIITSSGLYAISNAVYLESTNEFQITFRSKERELLRLNQVYGLDDTDAFNFVLCDQNGDYYYLSHRVQSRRMGYVYDRLSFSGVSIDRTYHTDRQEVIARARIMAEGEDVDILSLDIREPVGSSTLELRFYYKSSDSFDPATADEIGGLSVFGSRTATKPKKYSSFRTQSY